MQFSVNHAANVFLAVLILGTLWRVSSLHLAANKNQNISHLGKAMAFQY